jgi:hypothetical protein
VAGADGADLVERQFARQHDAADAKLLRQRDALGAGDAHLRAAVDRPGGAICVRQLGDAHILHDDGVGARRGDRGQGLRGASSSSWSKTSVLKVT